jgi:hypothetical protein
MLRRYFGRRSDLGVWRFVEAKILQPQNPFGPRSGKPQRWFVLVLMTVSVVIAAFLYFSFWN